MAGVCDDDKEDLTRKKSFLEACAKGEIETVREQLAQGMSLYDERHEWYTPLHRASRGEHLDVVNLLLSKGAPVDAEDELRMTALQYTCIRDDLPLAQALVAHGASVNVDGFNGTPLFVACASGFLELARFLLSKGALVNKLNTDGTTPLHAAIRRGNMEVLMLLLSNGADVDVKDTCGLPPVVVAYKMMGGREIMKVLLRSGAKVDDYWKRQILSSVCGFGSEDLETAQLLLPEGVELDEDLGCALLGRASCQGNFGTVKTLIARGAKVDIPHNGQFPLHQARNGEIARFLLLHGADVNARNNTGQTALKSSKNYYPLLDYGAGSGLCCEKACTDDECDCEKACTDDECDYERKYCMCQTTELMCKYRKMLVMRWQLSNLREDDSDYDDYDGGNEAETAIWLFQRQLDPFRAYFMKTEVAGIRIKGVGQLKEPEDRFTWDQQRTDAFRTKCKSELERMKHHTIDNTTATYHDLFLGKVASEHYHSILENFNIEECCLKYPVYGNMTVSRYLKIHRLNKINQSTAIFTLTENFSLLPPECAELVLAHLPNSDLDKLLKILRSATRKRISDAD